LREHLAELDAPLVERIDVPDRGLREHAVLVERHQRAQRRRREAREEQRVGGAIALEHTMRHDRLGNLSAYDELMVQTRINTLNTRLGMSTQ